MPGGPIITNPYTQKGQTDTVYTQGQAIAKTLGNTPNQSGAQAPLSSFFSASGTSLKMVVYWGVAALALVALAKPYPNLATMFVVLLIVGVVLTHYQEYIGLFSPPKK